MAVPKRVALVGDFNPDVMAHQAIPKALQIASLRTGHPVEGVWVGTSRLCSRPQDVIREFDSVWCVPASPYENMDGALGAIRYAREHNVPFLGTCGGYQHAVLEFARNVLGYTEADNAEVNPEAEMPLVAPLVCALVEQSGEIEFVAGSQIAKIHNTRHVTEKYHCSFGISPRYVELFDDSALDISGFDKSGEPRAVEITTHPFFIGTAYQPERSALSDDTHPLIEAFVAASAGELSLAS